MHHLLGWYKKEHFFVGQNRNLCVKAFNVKMVLDSDSDLESYTVYLDSLEFRFIHLVRMQIQWRSQTG